MHTKHCEKVNKNSGHEQSHFVIDIDQFHSRSKKFAGPKGCRIPMESSDMGTQSMSEVL
jgi:hypothetical protein